MGGKTTVCPELGCPAAKARCPAVIVKDLSSSLLRHNAVTWLLMVYLTAKRNEILVSVATPPSPQLGYEMPPSGATSLGSRKDRIARQVSSDVSQSRVCMPGVVFEIFESQAGQGLLLLAEIFGAIRRGGMPTSTL